MNVSGEDMYANKMKVQGANLDGVSTRFKGAKKAATADEINKAAEEFEAVYLSEMFSHMFSGIQTDPLMGGGHGEDMWKSFMTQEYAKVVARSGGIGVADHVKREMLKLQEENIK